MIRLQRIIAGNRQPTFRSAIYHCEAIMRLSGSAVLPGGCWYNTSQKGDHLNRLIGFSTDFFGDDSIELAWRPSVNFKEFDIYAFVRIGGKWIRHENRGWDKINTVTGDKYFYFDVKHRIPDAENPEDCKDENRLATFAVNGRVVSRRFGVTPGWAGWIRNFKYGHKDGAPFELTTTLNYSLNLHRD